MDMKLEVVVIGVPGVGRAKAFYEKLGSWGGADFIGGEGFRAIRGEWKG